MVTLYRMNPHNAAFASLDLAETGSLRTHQQDTTMIENKKKPNPIDIHVGSRIRLRRTMLGMSQEKLGESLGITFQQIQKYEKGTNRVGASRLQAISGILNVPVSFFFEDAPDGNPANTPAGMAEASSSNYVVDFLSSSEGLQLNRAFVKIGDQKVRRKIVDLVKALAADAEAE
jgi:transcriptional regulator with XRE-family HTH domain